MNNVWWILRRELAFYLKAPIGYIIIAAALGLDGLFFNGLAVGSGARKSNDVLEMFFLYTGGTILAAGVFVGMRLIAEERQTGTFTLLATSPIREWQLVLGKYLSALTFLAVMTGLTLHMPLLLMVNGKISLAHIVAGYLGVLLLASAGIALFLVCSALSPNQLVAAVLGAGVAVAFTLLWFLSRIASPPVDELLAYMALFDKHFRPFMRGIISIQDVVFYLSLTYLGLVSATRIIEARRWR